MSEVEVQHFGSCHCGEIKFEVFAPKSPIIVHCKYVLKTFHLALGGR